MRHLIILRGVPGAGKSFFIEKNNLKPYTISADEIRLLFQGPLFNSNGELTISQQNDKKVWELLFQVLSERMKKGELIILDATHTKTSDFNKYKPLIEKFRYRAYCLDFGEVSIEEAKQRNEMRPEYKRVPENIIDLMSERIKNQNVPAWVEIIKPEEFTEKIQWKPVDLSRYAKIHHIGDLQGCCEPLKQYFLNNPIDENELYVFVGDYLDRGIENGEVLEYLLELSERTNFIFLEGNHEAHLIKWANDEISASKEFELKTKIQLENKNFDKKQVRIFCRKLRQVLFYKYFDKQVVVSHGGISKLPNNLAFIPTQQFTHGVGSYGDAFKVAESFSISQNCYQVHGHRNLDNLPIEVTPHCFNLEGKVEFGGQLRIVTLSEEGFVAKEIQNNTFASEGAFGSEIDVNVQNKVFIEALRENKFIKEKNFGNISSFNFSREAFFKGAWDEQTMRARGLFLNTNNGEVIIRSYNKFFNLNERPETQLQNLEKNLQFPLQVYLKENGFLGLLGYNSEQNELVFATKSVIESDFVNWFREIFTHSISLSVQEEVKKFLRDNNVCLAFEVLDPFNDAHIIEYKNRDIILLDIIKRNPEFEKLSYSELNDFAHKFGFQVKKLEHTFNNYQDFLRWYENISNDYSQQIEGYVLEDNVGFHVKIKLPYYSFWKRLRGLKEQLQVGKQPKLPNELKDNELAKNFFAWLQSRDASELAHNITHLRKQFLASEAKLEVCENLILTSPK